MAKKNETAVAKVEVEKDDPAVETEVTIERHVYQKVMHWVNKSEFEVSGLGKVVMRNGMFRVVDAWLLPQENSYTTTDIDPNHMGKLMYQTKDTPGTLNWWFHSHVDMPTFWSMTDLNTIKLLGKGGWFLNTVFNKKKEKRTSLYMKTPVEAFFDDIKTYIQPEQIDKDLVAAWDKQYADNVKNVVPKFEHWASSTRFNDDGGCEFVDDRGNIYDFDEEDIKALPKDLRSTIMSFRKKKKKKKLTPENLFDGAESQEEIDKRFEKWLRDHPGTPVHGARPKAGPVSGGGIW